MTWYQIVLLLLQFIVGISLILIVLSQTSKNEGLTGSIGGNMPSNFKGKPGFEERLKMYTRNLGVAWFLVSILVGIAFRTA